MLDELEAVHDFRHGFAESLAEPGGAQRLAAAVAANPPVTHPLVRTHPESGTIWARESWASPVPGGMSTSK